MQWMLKKNGEDKKNRVGMKSGLDVIKDRKG